jgi:hypothetical protein
MQWPEKMRKLAYTFIACCLAAIACTSGQLVDYDQPLSIEEYQERYSNFGDPWVGHQVEAYSVLHLLQQNSRRWILYRYICFSRGFGHDHQILLPLANSTPLTGVTVSVRLRLV